MGRTQNRPLPLILARELASNVATAFLVLDRDGTLIFFNDRAEQIIGSSPAGSGIPASRASVGATSTVRAGVADRPGRTPGPIKRKGTRRS